MVYMTSNGASDMRKVLPVWLWIVIAAYIATAIASGIARG